jgi:hypothetical protein
MTLARPITWQTRRDHHTGTKERIMRDLEAVLSDLEWRRVRRKVAMHPAVALFWNCGTTALIVCLKFAAPALAR